MISDKDWQELAKKINVIYVLADVQESLILEVEKKLKREGELEFSVKHYVNNIKNNARLLVQQVNRYAKVHNDNFAHDADELKKIIDMVFFE